jgi:hypothetical protein
MHLFFAQIYELHKYGQYKMHGIVINVLTNVNQTQSILPLLQHDNATICVFFNWHLISNHLIYQKNSSKYGDCQSTRFNQNDII